MYAVIQTGGKQYKVKPGDRLYVEKREEPVDSQIMLDALLLADGENVRVGTPTVAGVQVVAKVGETEKGEKLRIFKMKRRKGYRRKTGHRQPYTTLNIVDIQA